MCQENESTIDIIKLRNTEQAILNFMLLSMESFRTIKEELIPSDFTFNVHKMIFSSFCKMEEYFEGISSSNNFDVNELSICLDAFSNILFEQHNVKKASTLNILSKEPSLNIEDDLNRIKFLTEEKKFALNNHNEEDAIVQFNFEDTESYTVAKFIQNRIIEIVTTNIDKLPIELCDTAQETMKKMSEIDLKDPENDILFSPPESEPIGVTIFDIRKNISILEKRIDEQKKKFQVLFEWADKYNLDEKIFPRDINELLKIDELQVSNMSIEEFPKELVLLEKLIFIDASFNKLKTIPTEFKDFNRLMFLQLESNNFEAIPRIVLDIKSLKFLSFKANTLSVIPTEINKLNNLKHICLCQNKIEKIPNEFSELDSLENFCIHGNKLNFLPRDIKNLKSLEVFSISNNHIKDLPKELTELKQLKSFEFENNEIENIDLDILKLPNINQLAFDDSLFPYILENMEFLQNIDTINLTESTIDEKSNLIKKLQLSLDLDSWVDSEDKRKNGCIKLSTSKEQTNEN